MRGSDAEDFFTAQEIFLMFPLPPQSFVAVEPFGFSQTLVIIIEIATTYAETYGCEQYEANYGINPFGDCRPDSTVNHASHTVVELSCCIAEVAGLTCELVVDAGV